MKNGNVNIPTHGEDWKRWRNWGNCRHLRLRDIKRQRKLWRRRRWRRGTWESVCSTTLAALGVWRRLLVNSEMKASCRCWRADHDGETRERADTRVRWSARTWNLRPSNSNRKWWRARNTLSSQQFSIKGKYRCYVAKSLAEKNARGR